MKKFLLAVLSVLLLSLPMAFAQQKPEEQSSSKTLEFMSSNGAFLVKEFYDLTPVRDVDCKVLIITDMVSGKKIGCMRLQTEYRSSSSYSSDTYIGTLDSDELDACIKSLTFLKDNLLNSSPETYTEAEYSSRDKINIGAYYSTERKQWKAYVQTKSYSSRSMKFFDAESLENLKQQMEKAKALIAEKAL